MASSVSMCLALASTTLGIRMSEVSQLVEESGTRMDNPAEEREVPLSLMISEPGPREGEPDGVSRLASDMGLASDSPESQQLARDVLVEAFAGATTCHSGCVRTGLRDQGSQQQSRRWRPRESLRHHPCSRGSLRTYSQA